MLVLRTEAYKEKEPNTYSSFMFDTNIDTGTPYYINSIKNEILQINGTINAIKRDINNLVDAYTLADKFPDLLKDTKNAFDKTTTELSDDISSIIDVAGQYLEALYKQSEISLDNLNELNQSISYEKDPNADKSILATAGTATLGLLEGLGNFGENMADATVIGATAVDSVFTGMFDAYQAISHIGSDEKWESMTKSMWEDTKAYVAEDNCKWMFDSFYDNELSGLRDKTYEFDTTRQISNGIGEAVPIVLAGVATGGGSLAASAGGEAATGVGSFLSAFSSGAGTSATLAGISGFGYGTETAWKTGASVSSGLTYGGLYGGWNAFQYYLGGKIAAASPFSSNLANAGSRILLSGADAGLEGIVNPGLELTYKTGYTDENGNRVEFDDNTSLARKYSNVFQEDGGWNNVANHFAIGAGLATIGEGINLAQNIRSSKLPSYEKIDANSIDYDSLEFDRGYNQAHLLNTYQGYDNVYNVKGNINDVLKDINKNASTQKNLIVVDNAIGLSEKLVSNLPENTDIRILGGYTDEYLNGFKIGGSAEYALSHVTYNKEELLGITREIENFDRGINPNWTEMEKAQYAYDYLQKNIRYDANPPGITARSKQMDGAANLIKHESTCQGFADTYKLLCDRMGIKCTAICGSLNNEGQHAYTIVNIDGKTFIVDPVRTFIKSYAGESGFNANPSAYFAKNNRDLLQTVKDEYK